MHGRAKVLVTDVFSRNKSPPANPSPTYGSFSLHAVCTEFLRVRDNHVFTCNCFTSKGAKTQTRITIQYHLCTLSLAVPSLQAAGGLNTPGPRRSARFANQQKPSSGSNAAGQQQSATPRGRQSGSSQRGQPDCNNAQAQLQRSWLQTFIWIAWSMLAVLVAVMAATNPSRAAFWDSISQLTTRGLGQWAGAVLLSPCVGSHCTLRHKG